MIKKYFVVLFFSSILLFGCSQKNNIIDFDLSNLPKPKPKTNDLEDKRQKDLDLAEKEGIIKDLVPFKNREKLLSEFKYGKKDPFAKDESQINRFSSDLKLNGFLNSEDKKYVFVSYLGIEGTISQESVGGLNTNLLPKGAKVIDIDTKNMQLKINFKNEDFIFEL